MKRTRWTRRAVGGLLALATLGGCKQQLFIDPADYKGALDPKLARLESQPYEAIGPSTPPPQSPPATVLDPSRPPRLLTLKEVIAIALEQGNLGGTITNSAGISTQAGFATDILPSFTGRGATLTDTIRTFAYDPAVAAAEIERALSKFDARWINSMTWNKQDQPTLTLQQSFSNGDSATLSSTLAKPLPTGGTAGITFSMNYLKLANPPTNTQFVALAASYTPQLQFVFEQPLLQSFGVEVNQLLGQHPGSLIAIPGLRPSGGVGSEGILVTRIRRDEARAQFDAEINQMLMNVETAYWNLYSAYYNLAAQEEGLKQSILAYSLFEARYRRGLTAKTEALQLAAQTQLFWSQVVTARGQVLTSERMLRGLMGMRSDDGTRLVPVDEPTVVPYQPDFYQLASDALQYRPELTLVRQELKVQQLNLILQKNQRRPDLRFFSSYNVAGLGRRLDGRDTPEDPNRNALQSFAQDRFNSWQLGLRLDMPIGFRDANALVREAEMNLWRAYFQVTDSERKALEFLTQQYRQVLENHRQVIYRRAQRQALQEYAELIRPVLEIGRPGVPPESIIQNVVQAQRDLATATAAEFQAIAAYNIALAGLEYATGTIQRYNNVAVNDGPLPPHVAKRAADHFREREAALKLREHPADLPMGPLSQYQPMADGAPPIPAPPAGAAPAVPNSTPWASPLPGTGLPMPLPAPPDATPAPKGPTPAPMTQPKGPPVIGSALPANPAQPTLAPAFTPIGTVSLPKRGGSSTAASEPLPPPTVTPEAGVGVPTVTVPTVAVPTLPR